MYLDKQEFMMEDNVDNMVIGMGIEEMLEEEEERKIASKTDYEKMESALNNFRNAKSESSYIDDINDLDNDEIEVVEEENNQDIGQYNNLLSSQLDLQKTIFCCTIRTVHESQLPKSDGENYFLDRMSPNEIYLLGYSEIKQLLL
nr:15192_t:CDS:2 [Entrophospora candida]